MNDDKPAAVPLPPPPLLVEIRIRNGAIEVSPDPAEVVRHQRLDWNAEDPNARWETEMKARTPFRRGRRRFRNKGHGNDGENIALGNLNEEFAYTVRCHDSNGNWVEIDPKIVIRDNPNLAKMAAEIAEQTRLASDWLVELAERTAELALMLRSEADED
jgi:hypothetical protein